MRGRVKDQGIESKTQQAKSAYGKAKKFLGNMGKAYNSLQKFLK